MKYVSFIRHAKLMDPYDDYNNVSLAQLESLAMQEVAPSINKRKARVDAATLQMLQLSKISTIVCADSVRAKQTAEILSTISSRRVRIIVSPLLNEIVFSPKRLVTQEEYDRYGMQILRDRLFSAIVGCSAGTESLPDVFERTSALGRQLQNLPDEDILCVTHGFYMRFLQLYFDRHVAGGVDEALLAEQPNHSNLCGFRMPV